MEKNVNKQLIRIAVTGPESTGKTTLAEGLAHKLNCLWVPEYAREYIDKINRPYDKHDVENIAHGQIKNLYEAEQKSNKILICDTELIVIKIWMEVKYGNCPEWIINEMKNQKFDLYLLCYPDIPWTFDKQREHPNLREYLFELYEKELLNLNYNYFIIKGDNISKRIELAYNKVCALMS